MNSRVQVGIIAALFIVLGLALTIYKHLELGFPLTPGQYKTVWTIEAKTSFYAEGGPVKASLALPSDHSKLVTLDESFGSSGYGFDSSKVDGIRYANWSKRDANGPQALYYRVRGYLSDKKRDQLRIAQPTGPVEPPLWSEADNTAAQTLLDNAKSKSADGESYFRQLILELDDPNNQNSTLLKSENSRTQIIINLLKLYGVHAQLVRGVPLEDQRRNIDSTPFLAVYYDNKWTAFDLQTGRLGIPKGYFIWQDSSPSMLDLSGGKNSSVKFSVISNPIPAKTVALMEGESIKAPLIDFSIYTLPVDAQSTFKFILMVPLGVLIVVVLRVLIGIKTSGTFMPVLMAIAFLQTSLSTGLAIFFLIVIIGLGIRGYLSRLNLLLVSRIGVIVTTVVILMALIAIFSYKLGWDAALTVTFFPMIILAWTIERMSIIWEEEGGKEVLIQGGGSLLVAIICYTFMKNDLIKHLFFNFPELLFSVVGIILLLGHYTGYKLSELHRFRFMKGANYDV